MTKKVTKFEETPTGGPWEVREQVTKRRLSRAMRGRGVLTGGRRQTRHPCQLTQAPKKLNGAWDPGNPAWGSIPTVIFCKINKAIKIHPYSRTHTHTRSSIYMAMKSTSEEPAKKKKNENVFCNKIFKNIPQYVIYTPSLIYGKKNDKK